MTSGVDAILYTLERFFGREGALETAERMGYPHAGFLDDATWHFTDARSLFPAVMPNAFRTGLVAESIHASGGYPYDLTLRDLARQETRPVGCSYWPGSLSSYPSGCGSRRPRQATISS